MKLVVLYRPDSEHSTEVETYLHDIEPQMPSGIKTQILSLNTRDGTAMASIYDVVSYPALLVTTDDGIPLQTWSGPTLPLMSEVVSYLRS